MTTRKKDKGKKSYVPMANITNLLSIYVDEIKDGIIPDLIYITTWPVFFKVRTPYVGYDRNRI